MVGEMENSVDVTKLAGRVVDAFGCDVDAKVPLQEHPTRSSRRASSKLKWRRSMNS